MLQSKSILALSTVVCVLAACTSTPERAANVKRPHRIAPDMPPELAQASDAPSSGASPLPVEGGEWTAPQAARTFERTLRVESRAEPVFLGLDEDEGSYWRDPEFRRRLRESFISETDVEPKIDLIETELMQQFYELMSKQKPDEAIALLNGARSDTSSAAIDMQLAGAYLQQERLEDAEKAMEIAVQKHPKFRRAWSMLGVTYFRTNDYVNAQRALTKAIETGANTALNFGLLGFCYLNLEDSLAAESAYRMALLLDPATEDWKSGLAQSLSKQNRFADVIALCGDVLEKHPERTTLWLRQADAYVRAGQPMRAAENFELLDRMGELDASNLNALGVIYFGEELYDLAVSAYERALEKDPALGPEAAIRAARELVKRGAQDESRELIERIEAKFPELPDEQRRDVLRIRARLALAAGGGEAEARILEEVVRLDPLDGDSLIRLGAYAKRTGDVEKAVLYYERAEGIERYEADAKVQHAQLLVGQNKYAEALVLLRRAQSINPREYVQKYLEDVERVSQGRAQQ